MSAQNPNHWTTREFCLRLCYIAFAHMVLMLTIQDAECGGMKFYSKQIPTAKFEGDENYLAS